MAVAADETPRKVGELSRHAAAHRAQFERPLLDKDDAEVESVVSYQILFRISFDEVEQCRTSQDLA